MIKPINKTRLSIRRGVTVDKNRPIYVAHYSTPEDDEKREAIDRVLRKLNPWYIPNLDVLDIPKFQRPIVRAAMSGEPLRFYSNRRHVVRFIQQPKAKTNLNFG